MGFKEVIQIKQCMLTCTFQHFLVFSNLNNLNTLHAVLSPDPYHRVLEHDGRR